MKYPSCSRKAKIEPEEKKAMNTQTPFLRIHSIVSNIPRRRVLLRHAASLLNSLAQFSNDVGWVRGAEDR